MVSQSTITQPSESRSTSRARASALSNESGQGVVEYMLGLMITVILILSFAYKFSTAFAVYSNNFFGGYIACLVETGELPGGALCDFKSFNLADGKTGAAGSGSGSSGSSGSGTGTSSSGSGTKNSGNGSNGGKNKNGSKSKTASDSGSSGSSSDSKPYAGGETVGTSGNGGSNLSGGKSGGRQRSTQVSNPNKDDGRGKGRQGLTPIGSVTNSSGNSNGGSRRTAMRRDFQYYGQEEDAEKEASRPSTKAVAKDESGALRPKKVAVTESRKPASTFDGNSEGFTFGSFLRWLLIAGILIAVFILFGGQLLEISKSGEK